MKKGGFMNLRKSLLAVSIFLCACFSFSCDSVENLISNFTNDQVYSRVLTEKQYNQMDLNVVTIKNSFKYRTSDGGRAKEWKTTATKATGFRLNENYILTLKHCVDVPRTVNTRTPFGNVITKHLFTKDQKIVTISDDKEWFVVGTDKDIALLSNKKDNHNVPIDIQIPIADLSDLKTGTKIYVIGNSMGICRNFKIGVFSTFFDMKDFPKEVEVDDIENLHNNILIISMPVSKGDSGSAVFVYDQKEKRMEVIGIIGMKIGYDCYGLVYRIDDALESVNKILTEKR